MTYPTENTNLKLAPTHLGSTSGTGIDDAEILFELGMIYLTGRDCDIDHVAAHKWFNIAAIKGNDRAAAMRNKLVTVMNKTEIAKALREARKWLIKH